MSVTTAITLSAVKNGDSFVVSPVIKGLLTASLLVDGEPLDHGRRDFQVDDLRRVTAYRSSRVTVSWRPTEDGLPALSPDEYESKKDALFAPARSHPDTDEDYTRWPSLDDEFAYRRFVSQYRSEQAESREDVEIEWSVSELPKTNNRHIIPLSHFGGSIFSPVVIYKRHSHIASVLRSAMHEYGIVATDETGIGRKHAPGTLKVYTHGDDVTVFGCDFHRKWPAKVWRGDLADAERLADSDAADVRESIATYATLRGVGVDSLSVASGLREILSQVSSLGVKRAAEDDRAFLRRSVIAMIDAVEAPARTQV